MSVGSINFTQSNSSSIQYLRGPQNSNLVLNGNFTIEFYIKCGIQVAPQDLYHLILAQYEGGGSISNNYFIYVANDGVCPIIVLEYSQGAVLRGTIPVNNNVWKHIAIVRNGMSSNNISLFVNGILDVRITNTAPWDYSGLNGFTIGTNTLDPNFSRTAYEGLISNMRIVNGTAVYTSNFTPSTTNLTAIPGTALLLNTAFNSPFLDSSPNNMTITPYNSPTASRETPMNASIVPCFKENSKILAYKNNLEQYINIQDLRSGDLVKTIVHGYVAINMIGKRDILHSHLNDRDKNGLYKCTQEHYPEVFEDLIITGCHSILVDEFLNQEQHDKTIDVLGKIYITDNKYRLPACVDERSIVYEKEGIFTIYHIALDSENYYSNYGIYANGLLVESCSQRYLKELSNMEII